MASGGLYIALSKAGVSNMWPKGQDHPAGGSVWSTEWLCIQVIIHQVHWCGPDERKLGFMWPMSQIIFNTNDLE